MNIFLTYSNLSKYIKIIFYFTITLGIKIYTNHKNFTCNALNTDILLIGRLIIEYYGPEIEYIQGSKTIVADALSTFPIHGNKETTQESTYKKCIVSEINDIE